MMQQEPTGDPGPHVHFIAIGGAGMGALASILLQRGYRISGSDVAENATTKRLREQGATVFFGHDASHVAGADWVVYSSALSVDNVELQAARESGVPVLHRSEMLARVMDQGRGIAIAGAHGKTTTTSMVALVFERAGLDPTFVVGGVLANLNTGAHAGSGEYVIAEADESDRSFLNYRPWAAAITNIEADHLEYYDGKFANLKRAYREFALGVDPAGVLIGCGDDEHVRDVMQEAPCRTITYSTAGTAADYAAVDVQFAATGSRFRVLYRGEELGEAALRIPGAHNIANALAAIALAREAGIAFPAIVRALAEFSGALRRFQTVYEGRGVLIMDDYAHHPTEIRATIHALKVTGRRIVAVFQPQRYTRTMHLFEEFAAAFGEADQVIIADIYSPAGEQPIAGVTAERLTAAVRKRSNATAVFCQRREDVLARLRESVREGDLVLTMGAGDVWRVGAELAEWLEGSGGGPEFGRHTKVDVASE